MNLSEFFEENPIVAIAFSGGVDSAYLLYAAQKYAQKVKAYYVKSMFQPQFEYEDAIRLAGEIGVEMQVINVDVLENDVVAGNPVNRCYYCKKTIFSNIIAAANKDGFKVLLDGTNASDDANDRPGMRALKELKVLSPLQECGLTKKQIRDLSREAGLFTWDKPAYACLATRIPSGVEITKEMLEITEKSEKIMFDLGFSDFRIRYNNGAARIQIKEVQMPMLLEKRKVILEKLKPFYRSVELDLEAR